MKENNEKKLNYFHIFFGGHTTRCHWPEKMGKTNQKHGELLPTKGAMWMRKMLSFSILYTSSAHRLEWLQCERNGNSHIFVMLALPYYSLA